MRIALTIDQGPGEACHAKNPTSQQESNKNPARSSLNDVDRWHIKQNSVSQEERVDSPLPRAALHISCLPFSTPTLGDWILSQEPGTTPLWIGCFLAIHTLSPLYVDWVCYALPSFVDAQCTLPLYPPRLRVIHTMIFGLDTNITNPCSWSSTCRSSGWFHVFVIITLSTGRLQPSTHRHRLMITACRCRDSNR